MATFLYEHAQDIFLAHTMLKLVQQACFLYVKLLIMNVLAKINFGSLGST